MKKRIIRLSLVLALMLCLSVSVFAESQLWHITDDAGILTESQNIELEIPKSFRKRAACAGVQPW